RGWSWINQYQLTPLSWLLLWAIGLTLCLSAVFYYFYAQTILSFRAVPISNYTIENRRAAATSVSISSAAIELPITAGEIKDGIWQVANDTATHLRSSANPGEMGNIVIYGHNKRQIFGGLHTVKVGDIVTLSTSEGQVIQYEVKDISVVEPSEITTVLPTEYEVVTIYTCTGFFDSQRLVIKAFPLTVNAT
nr:sortase [bacterium]